MVASAYPTTVSLSSSPIIARRTLSKRACSAVGRQQHAAAFAKNIHDRGEENTTHIHAGDRKHEWGGNRHMQPTDSCASTYQPLPLTRQGRLTASKQSGVQMSATTTNLLPMFLFPSLSHSASVCAMCNRWRAVSYACGTTVCARALIPPTPHLLNQPAAVFSAVDQLFRVSTRSNSTRSKFRMGKVTAAIALMHLQSPFQIASLALAGTCGPLSSATLRSKIHWHCSCPRARNEKFSERILEYVKTLKKKKDI